MIHPLRTALALLAALSVTALVKNARADDAPHRRGFTLELGLGVSYTDVSNNIQTAPNVISLSGESPIGRQNQSAFGLAPLSIGVGAFITRDFSLMARLDGTSFFVTQGGFTQVFDGFYGGAGQLWLSDNFFVGAGVGLGLYATNPLVVGAGNGFSMNGLSFLGRAGYAFAARRHYSLSAVFELIPSFYRDHQFVESGNVTIVGSAMKLEFQYY